MQVPQPRITRPAATSNMVRTRSTVSGSAGANPMASAGRRGAGTHPVETSHGFGARHSADAASGPGDTSRALGTAPDRCQTEDAPGVDPEPEAVPSRLESRTTIGAVVLTA